VKAKLAARLGQKVTGLEQRDSRTAEGDIVKVTGGGSALLFIIV
jgi:hypothetical protein